MVRLVEYDNRQLKLMLDQLISFEKGKINLLSLQSSLEFLFQAMEHVDEDWENLFLDEISALASINAGINPDSYITIKLIVNETVVNLKKLIERALN